MSRFVQYRSLWVKVRRASGNAPDLSRRRNFCAFAGGLPLLLILSGRRLVRAADVDAALAEEPQPADSQVRRTLDALWRRATPDARFVLASLAVAGESLTMEELAAAAKLPVTSTTAALILSVTRSGTTERAMPLPAGPTLL